MVAPVELRTAVVAGFVSGSLTRLLISPLDVLKVRLQLQIEPIRAIHSSKYHGLYHATRKIFKEEGARAFWKGSVPGQLMYAVFGAVQFTTYEASKQAFRNFFTIPESAELWKVGINFTSGCVAGAVATTVSYPLDVLRTRFIGQIEPKVYSNLYQAVTMMYSEKGLRTFYKGLTPSLLSITPQAGLVFGLYHTFTSIWDAVVSNQSVSSSLRSLACGTVAGILSKTAMLPWDLVKKRLQIQGFEKARQPFGKIGCYRGVTHCLLSILMQEGVLAFYKGTSPALMKCMLSSFAIFSCVVALESQKVTLSAGMSTALSFLIYEHTLRILNA